MNIKTNEILDIEEIMTEIRKSIKLRQYQEMPIKFENIDVITNEKNLIYDQNKLLTYIHNVNSHHHIYAYRTIYSRKGLLGKIIIFIKKVLRKSIKFYIEPIVSDQNKFNFEVVNSINEIRNFILDKNDNNDNLNLKISKLELKLNKSVEKTINQLIEDDKKVTPQISDIIDQLDYISNTLKKQTDENLYLKNKIKLLNISYEILEKEIALLKNKLGE